MDEYNYYMNGYYGVPLATVQSPPQSISLESLASDQIEAWMQMKLQMNPMESVARVRGWLDAQTESSESNITAQDYIFSANYVLTTESDGDQFIRSEAL